MMVTLVSPKSPKSHPMTSLDPPDAGQLSGVARDMNPSMTFFDARTRRPWLDIGPGATGEGGAAPAPACPDSIHILLVSREKEEGPLARIKRQAPNGSI